MDIIGPRRPRAQAIFGLVDVIALAAGENLGYTSCMALRRKILLGLLLLPAATIVFALATPGLGAQLAFLILGVPVLVLNAWEFFLRDGGISFFDLSRKQVGPTTQTGSMMKTKWIAVLIGLGAVFLLLCLVYAGARSMVEGMPYSLALSTFLLKLGSRLWHFITLPVIFISLLIFGIALAVGPQLIRAVRRTGNETREAAAFPEIFQRPVQSPFAEVVSQSEDNESLLAMERMIGEGIDLKSVQLLLEIDGIDLTRPYLLSKVETLGIRSEALPAGAGPFQKESFYQGVLEGLYGDLFPLFCAIETKNEEKTARFTLKPGLRDRLMLRLNQGNLPPEQVTT